MLKIWKGLFYCMWMSDKPLVQQDLAARLAGLINGFQSDDAAVNFTEAFFDTMMREWPGIDKLRMDKFYNLVGEVLSAIFRRLKASQWSLDLAAQFAAVLQNGPLDVEDDSHSLGLALHLCEHLMARLVAVTTAATQAPQETVLIMLEPVWAALATSRGRSLFDRVIDGVFEPLYSAPNHFGLDWNGWWRHACSSKKTTIQN